MTRRIAFFIYGVASYGVFFATFLYAIGWVGNLWVPRSIDDAPSGPLGLALAIDLGLLTLFALQHSVMARPAFKRWWTRFVPEPIERSTYVLFSSLAMIAMFVAWQPLGGTIWRVEDGVARAALLAAYAFGWLLVLVSTFLINHFDLFGLRQVWLHLRGLPYTPLEFQVRSLYRLVRHPLYVGWFIVFWATPTMTATHLLFALMTSAYILVAVRLEERDLETMHPAYREYRERVPMLVPNLVGPGLNAEDVRRMEARV